MTTSPLAAYRGRPVLVAGAGVAGFACAKALLGLDAEVTVIDRKESPRLAELAEAGARITIAEVAGPELLRRVTDVIVSPGFPPHHALVQAAMEAGHQPGRSIYSEPELAWRLRGENPAPWLAITGTNGKTTTVTMLQAILAAAGLRSAALGNVGEPLVDAVLAPAGQRYDVLAVELSSFQLHWSRELAPEAGALLNVADDHLDWHGGVDAYAAAKAKLWRGVPSGGVAIANLDDPVAARILAQVSGRTVGVTLRPPEPGQLGVRDGVLVDRAFSDDPCELARVDQIRPVGEHNVANALAAAALARSYGVPAEAVRAGLAGYTPQPHRNAYLATVDGVDYVDDSKATNPHAAVSSLLAYPRVVWIAGGQLKDVSVESLVKSVADRLVGVVLIGVDRAQIADAVQRHAPGIPVVDVARTDDGAMAEAVGAAAQLARPGDTVLLAPAAASYDMFSGYADRGRRFAAAVAELRDR